MEFPIEILSLDAPTHSKSGFERPTSEGFYQVSAERISTEESHVPGKSILQLKCFIFLIIFLI